jgi:hypothetical protein
MGSPFFYLLALWNKILIFCCPSPNFRRACFPFTFEWSSLAHFSPLDVFMEKKRVAAVCSVSHTWPSLIVRCFRRHPWNLYSLLWKIKAGAARRYSQTLSRALSMPAAGKNNPPTQNVLLLLLFRSFEAGFCVRCPACENGSSNKIALSLARVGALSAKAPSGGLLCLFHAICRNATMREALLSSLMLMHSFFLWMSYPVFVRAAFLISLKKCQDSFFYIKNARFCCGILKVREASFVAAALSLFWPKFIQNRISVFPPRVLHITICEVTDIKGILLCRRLAHIMSLTSHILAH